MIRRRSSFALAALALVAFAAACGSAPADEQLARSQEPKPQLGLMTSLPLYWPLGAELDQIAQGNVVYPWQRDVLEGRFDLVPLDTLSPISGLSPEAPEIDPLEGIDRLAVIQPRGLSPADNVALDDWVRGGGQLLLVLDPALTGHYELPMGDPRRPSGTALIPPVVARWGMEITFDESQSAEVQEVAIAGSTIFVMLAGSIEASGSDCLTGLPDPILRCDVGEGSVTLLADAAMFEHAPGETGGHDHAHDHEGHDHAPENSGAAQSKPLIDLMRFAFSQ